MENEMAVPSEGFGLTLGRDPKSVLADAHRAAKALKDLISSKPKDEKVMMNGKQYLEFEDWQTLGAFYGAKAKAVSTEYVEIGTARGFKAKAVVVDANGNEISSAEAMCLNDEDKWSTRAKYEWVNGKREKVGDVAVPTFQLMSMAQTRACAKALRNVFSWVVVLAGYAPTPAEDMTGDETTGGGSTKEPIKPAAAKADASSATFIPSEVDEKEGEKDGKAWRKWGVKLPDGSFAGTFNEEFGFDLMGARDEKKSVTVKWKQDGKFKTLTEVTAN